MLVNIYHVIHWVSRIANNNGAEMDIPPWEEHLFEVGLKYERLGVWQKKHMINVLYMFLQIYHTN